MDATAAYKKANDLLERLTIEEKALMVRGYNKFFIKGFEEKGILPIYLSDATQGVNIRNNLPDPNVVKQLERSTAFPSPILLSLIHISEPTRRTPISYAVFCLKKKKKQ